MAGCGMAGSGSAVTERYGDTRLGWACCGKAVAVSPGLER